MIVVTGQRRLQHAVTIAPCKLADGLVFSHFLMWSKNVHPGSIKELNVEMYEKTIILNRYHLFQLKHRNLQKNNHQRLRITSNLFFKTMTNPLPTSFIGK